MSAVEAALLAATATALVGMGTAALAHVRERRVHRRETMRADEKRRDIAGRDAPEQMLQEALELVANANGALADVYEQLVVMPRWKPDEHAKPDVSDQDLKMIATLLTIQEHVTMNLLTLQREFEALKAEAGRTRAPERPD